MEKLIEKIDIERFTDDRICDYILSLFKLENKYGLTNKLNVEIELLEKVDKVNPIRMYY